MSDIQDLRAQIYDNYEAIDPGTKVLVLVRKLRGDGGYRAYIAARPNHLILLQDGPTEEVNLTVIDALEALLDRTCEWLEEDEHHRAEMELDRTHRGDSDSPSDIEQAQENSSSTSTEEAVRAVSPLSLSFAELERRRQKNLRRRARRASAKALANPRELRTTSDIV